MVDGVRVARLLRSVSDDLAVLRAEAAAGPERRAERAVGFRNVLVHDYVDVDDRVVLRRLEDPSDLAEFVTAVAERAS